MHAAHEFLQALTVVLCVAAVTTVLFQRLHQPVVLGYIIAGLIIGPYVPIPLVADREIVLTLSELGVILLMFSLGLEFSLGKLLAVGPTAGLTAVIQSSVMVWLGFIAGRAFGWTLRESLFAGAIIAISSTTIIAKAFDEQRVRGELRQLVVGILIVEDLIAIVLMAVLTAISSGSGLTAEGLLVTTGRLAAFLIGLLVLGMLLVPRAVRAIVRLDRPETLLVSSIGLCFAIALLAKEFGYSAALGAFLAGSLVAESGEEMRLVPLVEPVRDMFAAIFFVSVGMMIDPAVIVQHWAAVAVLTLVVILGKIVSVSFGAFVTGRGTRMSIEAGMSLAQIGEFSFIIAGLGLSLNAIDPFLYPIAVAVSAITTLTTPWLIRAARPTASWVDRRLPPPLQTFASLYGSWLEQMRSSRPTGHGPRIPRLVRLLLLDAAVLIAVVIGTAVSLVELTAWVARTLAIDAELARWLVVGSSAVLSAPFCVGVVRLARNLGATLADRVLPERRDDTVDLAAAPRRVLIVTLQLAVVLLVGAPLVALTQPFLPGLAAAAALAVVLALLAVAFWRSATNLEGHVRAGAQVVVEALANQSHARTSSEPYSLAAVHALLPGLGELVPIRLEPAGPAVGRTLAELDVRGLTGATVLAIQRGERSVVAPTANEVLQAGDVLALSGSHDAVTLAFALLTSGLEALTSPASTQ